MGKIKSPYRLLESREIYKNPWMRLREDKVAMPGGSEGLFGVVEMKGGSSVLALSDDNEAYLVNEYKYGIGRVSTGVVSGVVEESETPLDAAKRELKEETGLEASEWVDMGFLDHFSFASRSPNYLFLALGIREGKPAPDDGEVLQVIKVPFAQAVDMVMKSGITHAASCALILKAERYLHERKPKQ